jgi:eukaryotic-like serine/threonine-protein kinase
VLYKGPRTPRHLRFSPRGDRIAFLEGEGDGQYLRVVDLAGKMTTLAGPDLRATRLAWSPSGSEIYLNAIGRQGDDSIQAIDLAGRRRVLLRLPAFLVLHDIARDGRFLVERTSTVVDLLCLAPGASRERDLSWFDSSNPVALSSDGSLLLFNEYGAAAGKQGAFFVRGTDGGSAARLGEGDAQDLSPDGKWALVLRRDSSAGLMLVPTGTGSPRSIERSQFETVRGGALFPDGNKILVTASRPGGDRLIWVQDISSGKASALSTKGFGWTGHPISPDGKTVVAFRDWSEDLFLLSVDGGPMRTISDTKSLDPVRWSADGRFLFATEAGKFPLRVLKIDIATGRRELWREFVPAQGAAVFNSTNVVITPDAKAYAYGFTRAATSDLYLVEGLR